MTPIQFTSRRWLYGRSLVGLAFMSMAAAIALQTFGATAPRLPDVLDTPAAMRQAAQRATATGIDARGDTVVAVGPRGLIVRSTDKGATWQQVASPVSADLTSVRFAANGHVWVVGHDAVILKSVDGGQSWSRNLDGRQLLKVLQQAAPGNPNLAKELELTMEQSATADVWPSALLDLMFLDDQRGFAVGAFGLLLATVDGGQTWAPWFAHADNPRKYHLYAIRGDARRPYIAGEQGLLMRLDEAGQHFVQVPTPYKGSYFGVEVADSRVVAYGLRGNAYASADEGKTWQQISTGTDANIVGAAVQSGQLWLATQAGDLLAGPLTGDAVTAMATAPGVEQFAAVAVGPGRFAVARLNGVVTIEVRRAN